MTPPSSLPTFPGEGPRERALLEASRAVLALFLRHGHSEFSVKELADHTGLSERTFYRYFPRKEDAVRPYLSAGLAHVLQAIAAQPADKPLREVLLDAHAPLLDAAVDESTWTFLAVMSGNERLRAVWLGLLEEAERGLAELAATRLGLSPDSTHARLAGAVAVAAGRLALDSASRGGDRRPSAVFAECLDLLGPELFR